MKQELDDWLFFRAPALAGLNTFWYVGWWAYFGQTVAVGSTVFLIAVQVLSVLYTYLLPVSPTPFQDVDRRHKSPT